jgi:hypothetical protein
MILLKGCILLLISCISAILYRAGGQGKDPDAQPKWMPMWLRDHWVRDWLIPGVVLLTIMLTFVNARASVNIVSFICSYGLMGAALSTYWDWLFKGKDNMYMHGFGVGLALFPLSLFGMSWCGVIIRAVVLGLSMGLLQKYVLKKQIPHSDVIEEMGRGALIILTLPLTQIA